MYYDQLTLQKRDSGSLSDLQVQAEIRVDVSPSPTKIKRQSTDSDILNSEIAQQMQREADDEQDLVTIKENHED